MQIQPEKSEPGTTPMASAKGDLRQLKQNTSATVVELKAFLKQLKGKSPQEMLGVVAGSHLVRAIGLSCVIVFIATVVFTAIPYAMGGKEKPDSGDAEKSAAAPATPAAPAPAATPPATPAPDPNQPAPTAADLSRIGVGEEKKAPPNENPLENKKDNFLDGLD